MATSLCDVIGKATAPTPTASSKDEEKVITKYVFSSIQGKHVASVRTFENIQPIMHHYATIYGPECLMSFFQALRLSLQPARIITKTRSTYHVW
jgi:hypothetical protein